MDSRRLVLIAGLGCAAVALVVAVALGALLFFTTNVGGVIQGNGQTTISASVVTREVVAVLPTLVSAAVQAQEEEPEARGPLEAPSIEEGALAALYEDVNPGVVNIKVTLDQGGLTGQGAGSGFVLDDEGHIVTNNHVVADAEVVTVVFYNGVETRAEVIGTDDDSDLAVVRVDKLSEGARPLQIGESASVNPGDWVIAIGNPFSLGGSMSLGIVSAVGRAIASGATPFSIPQVIQTDAAINPGNSGGPLLKLDAQVVGVNAQIASSTGTNSGVGFAIPSDVVSLVVPALIEDGAYAWPWLGVSGTEVSLLLEEANNLPTQRGAYVVEVTENGPADRAGLRGATGEREVMGQRMPVGGDVIIEADGEAINDFTDLLNYVAFQRPGDSVELTILRGGERQQVTVELVARPTNLGG